MPKDGYRETNGEVFIMPEGIEHGYTVPSQTEITLMEAAIDNEDSSMKYRRDREREYPSVGDQLDVIWKEMSKKAAGGESYSNEAVDMLTNIMAVKTKYPKPEDE